MTPAMDAKTPLIMLGSGPYNGVMIDTFARYGDHFPYRLAGFAQNVDPARRGETVEGFPVYTLEELPPLAATHAALCILGDPDAKRRFVEQAAALGFRFATLIHPGCRLIGNIEVGEGCYLGFDTIFFRGARLGRHCTILTQGVIGEGDVFEDFAFAAAGVRLAGDVTVGEGAFIGVGAIVTERVRIGRRAIVGAGAVVVRDVPDDVAVVGNPAREIPRNRPLKPSLEST